jgi:hypothetical protein
MRSDDRATVPRRHLVISGTGRAGTSFLVRLLDRCGLETGDGEWYDRARAGLEHRLGPGAPYVVKDPMLGMYCDEVDMTAVAVDAVIVPLRDLRAAAASRLYQEHLARADADLLRLTDEVIPLTPGGIYASLEPVDVARQLAVIQHRLLHWAARWSIPVVLLDFPRMVHDADYLVDQLLPHLPASCGRAEAIAAFAAVADPGLLRVTDDVVSDPARRALLDRNEELRTELAAVRARRAELAHDADVVRADRDRLAAALLQRSDEYAGLLARQRHLEVAVDTADRAAADARRAAGDAATAAAARVTRLDGMLADAERRLAALRAELDVARARADAAAAGVVAMRATRAWRVTAPLRALRARLRVVP